jgi:hypothetical protein
LAALAVAAEIEFIFGSFIWPLKLTPYFWRLEENHRKFYNIQRLKKMLNINGPPKMLEIKPTVLVMCTRGNYNNSD